MSLNVAKTLNFEVIGNGVRRLIVFVHNKFSISSSPPSRLDKALSRDAPGQAGLSRTRLTRLITEGYVEVDGNIVKNPNANVSEGQSVKVLMPELEPVETLPKKSN